LRQSASGRLQTEAHSNNSNRRGENHAHRHSSLQFAHAIFTLAEN
jgi:hypothetical protein